jgi:hypothetical protein
MLLCISLTLSNLCNEYFLGNKKVWLFLIVNFGALDLGIKTRGYLKSEGMKMELA